jgi:hypothetical protein
MFCLICQLQSDDLIVIRANVKVPSLTTELQKLRTIDTCIGLTNVALLYKEKVAHQDFYPIWNRLLSQWIYNVDDRGGYRI